MIIAFANTFKQAKLATTGGADIEESKFAGTVSTVIRVLTSNDGDLLSHFDKITENKIKNSSLNQMLVNNHNTSANKGKTSGQLSSEHISAFYKRFQEITEGLKFHILFKTADLPDIIYTTLDNNNKMKIHKLNLNFLVNQ